MDGWMAEQRDVWTDGWKNSFSALLDQKIKPPKLSLSHPFRKSWFHDFLLWSWARTGRSPRPPGGMAGVDSPPVPCSVFPSKFRFSHPWTTEHSTVNLWVPWFEDWNGNATGGDPTRSPGLEPGSTNGVWIGSGDVLGHPSFWDSEIPSLTVSWGLWPSRNLKMKKEGLRDGWGWSDGGPCIQTKKAPSTDGFIRSMTEWWNDQMDEWMNGKTNEWMIEWKIEWKIEWMIEWRNQWLDEWMEDWKKKTKEDRAVGKAQGIPIFCSVSATNHLWTMDRSKQWMMCPLS